MNSIMQFDTVALQSAVARRQLEPAKQLTTGQLRIATVPSTLRPKRAGPFDRKWLKPVMVFGDVTETDTNRY